MRRSAIVMLVVGALLLAAAAATRFLAYPALDQLPYNFDRTAVYSGTGSFLNPSALQSGNAANALLLNQDVTVNRHVKVTSTHDSTAVVSDDISGQLTNGTKVLSLDHTWAIDRKTMLAAPAPSGVTVDPHQGITIGFPIDVQQRDYDYWDSNTQQTVPAKYQRAESYSGRNAYVFTVSVTGQVKDPKLLASLPTALPKALLQTLAGLLPPAAQAQLQAAGPSLPAQIPLSYTSANSETAWIDSDTGLPLNVQQQQTVTAGLSLSGSAVPLLPVLQLSIKNTPASVSQAANDAKNYSEGLSAVGTWVPIVLLVLGLLFLALAVLLQRRRRPAPPAAYTGSGGPRGPGGPGGPGGSDGSGGSGGYGGSDGLGGPTGSDAPAGASGPGWRSGQ